MPILGIDEVGRGPLAGPLVVGAVILPPDPQPWFDDLKDSKKLTSKKREQLNQLILATSATGLGWVPAKELDQLGISEALRIATHRAVKSVRRLHAPFSQIIIDGKVNFLAHTPLAKYTSTCVKADAKIREVSAASIIAKVARDHYMTELAAQYPDYHFDQHVGYGTKAHLAAIYQYGLTAEHRRSFEPCKSLAGLIPTTTSRQHTSKPNSTTIGHQAESAVASYLQNHGHTIVARNHKTYFYEIDLISTKGDHIYFTEVKCRRNSAHGTPLDAIDQAKLKRMRFAATSYLKYTTTKYRNLSPILAAAAVTGSDYQVATWFPLT